MAIADVAGVAESGGGRRWGAWLTKNGQFGHLNGRHSPTRAYPLTAGNGSWYWHGVQSQTPYPHPGYPFM